jgi:Zn-dependent protease
MRILELFSTSPIEAIAFLLALVAAVSVHEFAHAWTAWRLGDDTPYYQGRVTLNPASHLDPIGSLMFLLIGMGWGRPVLYNPANLHRKVDELLVALAGPASNLLFALGLNILTLLVGDSMPQYAQFLQQASLVNVFLAAFNMIPIPPLDGSSIIAYFWPEYRSLAGGQVGLIILLVLIFLPVGPTGSLLSSLLLPIQSLFFYATTLFGLIG